MSSVCCQEDYFLTHDHKSYFQGTLDAKCTDDACFSLGTTVCDSGSCGVLTKYDIGGAIVFSIEIRHIDINSRRCMDIIDDKVHIVGLSIIDNSVKHLILDMEGNIISELVITRDENLDLVWPKDVLYLDDYFIVVVLENYENEARREALWKIDYEGNFLQHTRLPDFFRSNIYTLTQLMNGNIFVSQPNIDDSLCVFHAGLEGEINAIVFRELNLDSFEEIRSKEICYESTNRGSFDVTELANGDLVRTIISKSEDNIDNRVANVIYDESWEEKKINLYEPIEYSWPYGFGFLENRIFYKKGKPYYYVSGGYRYNTGDEEDYYIDGIIEKWSLNHEKLWRKTISSPITHKRVIISVIKEQGDKIKLFGNVYYDLDDVRTFDFSHMSLSLDGCFSDNCNDTIYVGELIPVSTIDIDIENSASIAVYPNPTHEICNIESKTLLDSIEVLNSSGRSILRRSLNGEYNVALDVSHLEKGVYVIRGTNDLYTFHKHFVKI